MRVTNDNEPCISNWSEWFTLWFAFPLDRGNRKSFSLFTPRGDCCGGSFPCPFSFDRRRSAMAVFTLVSLVLRGVSVRCGGESVNLRLGTEYTAGPQAPTVGHPMPHSMPLPASSANQLNGQPRCPLALADNFADCLREDPSGAQGTGRSLRGAGGASVRQSLSTATRSQITGTRISREASPARWLVAGSSKASKRSSGLTDAVTATA